MLRDHVCGALAGVLRPGAHRKRALTAGISIDDTGSHMPANESGTVFLSSPKRAQTYGSYV